jgi:hypothetical protein
VFEQALCLAFLDWLQTHEPVPGTDEQDQLPDDVDLFGGGEQIDILRRQSDRKTCFLASFRDLCITIDVFSQFSRISQRHIHKFYPQQQRFLRDC